MLDSTSTMSGSKLLSCDGHCERRTSHPLAPRCISPFGYRMPSSPLIAQPFAP